MHIGNAEYRVSLSGHCDLDLISIIMVSGAYLLHYLRKDSKTWRVGASWNGNVLGTILGSL